jgi:3-oxoacyl-[acyl-carrier protein] reductase
MQLKDKVVAVTGGAKGIGKAIASAFADKGARIALLDLVPADLEATRAELAARGVEARAYTTNVAREDQVVAALDAVVADFGRLDVLVNNAGIIKDGLLVKVKDGNISSIVRQCPMAMLPSAMRSVWKLRMIAWKPPFSVPIR